MRERESGKRERGMLRQREGERRERKREAEA